MMQQFTISVDAFKWRTGHSPCLYMKRLGITIEEVENTPTALANSTYTSYMLNVAHLWIAGIDRLHSFLRLDLRNDCRHPAGTLSRCG